MQTELERKPITNAQWKYLDAFFQADRDKFWQVVDDHWAVKYCGGLSQIDRLDASSVIHRLENRINPLPIREHKWIDSREVE